MTTITISNDSGKLTAQIEGKETPLQDVEQACALIEEAFGQEQPSQETPQEDQGEAFEAGFNGVRGGGLNGGM